MFDGAGFSCRLTLMPPLSAFISLFSMRPPWKLPCNCIPKAPNLESMVLFLDVTSLFFISTFGALFAFIALTAVTLLQVMLVFDRPLMLIPQASDLTMLLSMSPPGKDWEYMPVGCTVG